MKTKIIGNFNKDLFNGARVLGVTDLTDCFPENIDIGTAIFINYDIIVMSWMQQRIRKSSVALCAPSDTKKSPNSPV